MKIDLVTSYLTPAYLTPGSHNQSKGQNLQWLTKTYAIRPPIPTFTFLFSQLISLFFLLRPLTLASKQPFKHARFLSKGLHPNCVFHMGYPCKAHSNLYLLQVFQPGLPYQRSFSPDLFTVAILISHTAYVPYSYLQ